MKVVLWAMVLVGLCGLVTLGCNRSPDDLGDRPEDLAPKSNELPPLELRDDTSDLLLTWVDDKGDFHVSMKVADVPAKNREQVRVVVSTKKEGTGRLFYVEAGLDRAYFAELAARADAIISSVSALVANSPCVLALAVTR